MGSLRQVNTSDGLWWMGVNGQVIEPPLPEPSPDPEPPPPPIEKPSVRGVHGSAGMGPPPRSLWGFWLSELLAMGVRFYKQLDSGDPNDLGDSSTFAWCKFLKRNGIEPIVRFYQHRQFPRTLPDEVSRKMRSFATEGVVWAEIGNEPNLDNEWEPAYTGKLSWQNPRHVADIAEAWIHDSIMTLNSGMRPGFYALAPTDWGSGRPHPRLSSVKFYERIIAHINKIGPDLLQNHFDRGAWLAVHSSTYEHPPEFDPYPVGEHPYDMCLRGYQIPIDLLNEMAYIIRPVVMSTEGGVFCYDSLSMTGHKRLSGHVEHAFKTEEMFDWLWRFSPMVGMCPWLISNESKYIGHGDTRWAGDGWYRTGLEGADLRSLPVVSILKGSN